jgi:hypothetical protein
MVILSQLQLEHFHIRSLRMVETVCRPATGDANARSLKIRVNHTVEDDKDNPASFVSDLQVRVAPETAPASGQKMLAFDIEIVGKFRILGECTSDQAKSFRSQSAPAILYGVCRGICAMVTGVSTLGRNDLPTLNLMGLSLKPKKAHALPLAGRKRKTRDGSRRIPSS